MTLQMVLCGICHGYIEEINKSEVSEIQQDLSTSILPLWVYQRFSIHECNCWTQTFSINFVRVPKAFKVSTSIVMLDARPHSGVRIWGHTWTQRWGCNFFELLESSNTVGKRLMPLPLDSEIHQPAFWHFMDIVILDTWAPIHRWWISPYILLATATDR